MLGLVFKTNAKPLIFVIEALKSTLEKDKEHELPDDFYRIESSYDYSNDTLSSTIYPSDALLDFAGKNKFY